MNCVLHLDRVAESCVVCMCVCVCVCTCDVEESCISIETFGEFLIAMISSSVGWKGHFQSMSDGGVLMKKEPSYCCSFVTSKLESTTNNNT